MKESETSLGKAYAKAKAAPAYGSSGSGDEPVRVGVGQRPFTKEELFNRYLDSIQDLPFEAKVAALTAAGVGIQFARAISKGLNPINPKGLGNPMNPVDVSRVTGWQNDYQKGLKDFAKNTSQIRPLPQTIIDDIKQSGAQTVSEVVGRAAAKEVNDAYHNYRLVPITKNKNALDNIVNKYGGPENVKFTADSVTINPYTWEYNKATKDLRLSLVNEELANSSISRAAGALNMIQKWTGKDIAEAEAIASKPTVSGAVKGGISAVGNAYNNALSFLRGGGPKTMGK